jgi:hypothetical protein
MIAPGLGKTCDGFAETARLKFAARWAKLAALFRRLKLLG